MLDDAGTLYWGENYPSDEIMGEAEKGQSLWIQSSTKRIYGQFHNDHFGCFFHGWGRVGMGETTRPVIVIAVIWARKKKKKECLPKYKWLGCK